jgi:hypothetical protein
VASIDPNVRESSIAGDWLVTYTLVEFNSEGTDYAPYIAVGGEEEWEWTVTPDCPSGPCHVHFDAYNALLGLTYPSGIDWDAQKTDYFSSGVTAAPAAFCRDQNGARIPDSFEVEQTLLLVPQSADPAEAGLSATELTGIRVDQGRPTAGMPESCGTFTEIWTVHAVRAGPGH